MRSHTRRAVRSLCVLSCLGLISYGLIGCGGSDSPSPTPSPSVSPSPTASPTSTPARARVMIEWGDRSRVEGVSSALSAVIQLRDAKVGGGNIVFTAERPRANISPSIEYRGAPAAEYTSTEEAITGQPFELTVTFYSEPNQGGSVVGIAQANATVRTDGSVDSTISTFGTIRSVVVEPNQTVAQGQTVPLRFEGRSADGKTIMVRPGTAKISIASGADRVAVEGESLRGVRPRDASVVVVIDKATSSPTPVIVTSDTLVTPNVAALTLSIEKTFAFTANVSGSNVTDRSVTWAIIGGPADASITPAGVLTVGRTEVGFTVTATSVYDSDPTKVVRIPVTVASKVNVAIQNKALAAVGIGDKLQLTALVSDPDGPIPVTDVTWAVVNKTTGAPAGPAFGTVDATGLYSAPTTAGSYRVVATSKYDTRKSDFVDVEVRAGNIGVDVQ